MNGITEGDNVIALLSGGRGGWHLENGVAEYVGSTHARVRREGDIGTSYDLPSWTWYEAILDTPANRFALATFVAEKMGRPSDDPTDGARFIEAISGLR